MAKFKPRETQGKHTVHHMQNKLMETRFWFVVHAANASRKQQGMFSGRGESRRAKPNSADSYV